MDRLMGKLPIEPNSMLAHIHIPKTAGVAVQSVLKAEFSPNLHLAWDKAREEWKQANSKAPYDGKFLTGHLEFSGLFYPGLPRPRPIYCIAVIREPLKRVVSLYNYNRSNMHPRHASFAEKFASLDDYVLTFTGAKRAANRQVRWLCGRVNDRDLLMARLNKHYIGVATQDRTDWYLSRVVSAVKQEDRTIEVPVVNTLKRVEHGTVVTEADISPVVLEKFRNANQLDLELYDTIMEQQEKLGAYPNTPRAAQPPTLQDKAKYHLRRVINSLRS